MTGGVFTVTIWHAEKEAVADGGEVKTQEIILWDRKRDGGFPGMFCLLPCMPILPQHITSVSKLRCLCANGILFCRGQGS